MLIVNKLHGKNKRWRIYVDPRYLFTIGNIIVFSSTSILIYGIRENLDITNAAGFLCLAGYYLVWLADTSRRD